MNVYTLFAELRNAGVMFSLREDGTLRSRALKGALTPEQRAALQAHAPALLQVLRTELQGTPANHPEPCAHPRIYTRPDGARLCTECWHEANQGTDTWRPVETPARCLADQHEPYLEHSSMPGIRQCTHCPHVWRETDHPTLAPSDRVGQRMAPCPSCTETWYWPTTGTTGVCSGCVVAGRITTGVPHAIVSQK